MMKGFEVASDELPSRIVPATVPEFIQAARQGSKDALDRLLESYRTYLRLVARRGLGRDLLPKIDPSDLAQVTLIEAHRDFHRFSSSTHSRLQAWLTELLRNNIADARKRFRDAAKRDVSREVPLDSSLKELARSNPTSAASTDMRSENYQAALTKLPPHYQETIHLRHTERLSFKEIGERLDKTADAARMLYGRAIEALKAECEDDKRPEL